MRDYYFGMRDDYRIISANSLKELDGYLELDCPPLSVQGDSASFESMKTHFSFTPIEEINATH
jgi:hypothetical protein